MKLLNLIFCTLIVLSSQAQTGVANNWHFGNQGTLNFTSGNPVSSGVSSIFANEGSVSYSDPQGNLLFYTNCVVQNAGSSGQSDSAFVWNRYHQPMPNGDLTGVTGRGSPSQGGIVLPVPGSNNRVYLFCIDGVENDGINYKGLTYSIIDMSLDNGLGDLEVKGVSVNTPSDLYLAEKITATRHANGVDYWLVVHERLIINSYTNKFFVFLVDENGINYSSTYEVGEVMSPILGTMQFSFQGDKLAYNGDIFAFDKTTGVISPDPITVCNGGYKEFSKSGRFLYVSEVNYGIFQVDLESPGYPETVLEFGNGHEFAQLQMAPDGKIYVSMSFNNGYQNTLSVINDPEEPGTSCNFVKNQISLNGAGECRIGLPNMLDCDIFPNEAKLQDFNRVSVLVYPNPFKNMINYSTSRTGELLIVNSIGETVFKGQFLQGSHSVDMSEFNQGVYFLEFTTSQGSIRKKAIKY